MHTVIVFVVGILSLVNPRCGDKVACVEVNYELSRPGAETGNLSFFDEVGNLPAVDKHVIGNVIVFIGLPEGT